MLASGCFRRAAHAALTAPFHPLRQEASEEVREAVAAVEPELGADTATVKQRVAELVAALERRAADMDARSEACPVLERPVTHDTGSCQCSGDAQPSPSLGPDQACDARAHSKEACLSGAWLRS